MSTTFTDVWRPALVTCAVAIEIGVVETVARQSGPYGLFAIMTGESYFRAAVMPWGGLLVSVAVAAGRRYRRHDEPCPDRFLIMRRCTCVAPAALTRPR